MRADSRGLPRDPGLWLRTETIDAFVLSGCPGLEGSTVQTCRTWLRRTREALVWIDLGRPRHPGDGRDARDTEKRGNDTAAPHARRHPHPEQARTDPENDEDPARSS
ncbi:hypothetical protein [Streptomyces sp. NPDC014676]|uniref:hypothetical protein n=1 Tax=Streptomyces sp. NPDC014676 TaxID=3364879 RepID=UPI0036F772F0